MEKPIYDFKKGDIDYDEKRKQYLINLNKYNINILILTITYLSR